MQRRKNQSGTVIAIVTRETCKVNSVNMKKDQTQPKLKTSTDVGFLK